VHVYRNERFVVKWDLENDQPMIGKATTRLIELIHELDEEGKI
jgi:hypothetical protein